MSFIKNTIILGVLLGLLLFTRHQISSTDFKGGHVGIIGAGFSGLSAACYLRQMGYEVSVFEKNNLPGGRANVLEKDGFKFDMGPSWFWMPEVFEEFFHDFGWDVTYSLRRLDPSYTVFWDRENATQHTSLGDSISDRRDLFETLEPGSGPKLDRFLEESKWKYDVGMSDYVQRPGMSFFEMIDVPFRAPSLFFELWDTQRSYVAKFVSHPWCKVLLEWPVLFLGAEPSGIPSLYSLMNWADWGKGTWYPSPGGFHAVADDMYKLALDLGVKFHFQSEVTKIDINPSGEVTHVETGAGKFDVDALINSADYHFVEQNLLPKEYRRYDEAMWDSQVFAPACYLYYLGFDTKIPDLEVHTFFFHDGMDAHLETVYQSHTWPEDPVFYANTPSKVDPETAPEGHEAVFILIPVSPNLHGEDTPEKRQHYLDIVLSRMSTLLEFDLRPHLVSEHSFAHQDFQETYHAYKGNAFGLANTLFQMWMFKPKMQSLVSNLVFVGQLTAPGPGVPPALISGRMGANLINDTIHGDNTDLYLGAVACLAMVGLFLRRREPRSLNDDYEVCRRLHLSHGVSYYISTLLLPEHLQKHVFALYGITRTADEIVDDGQRTPEQMRRDMAWFENDFFGNWESGRNAKHPVNRAALATARELNLSKELFVRFFRAMKTDITKPLRFETMDDLLCYMDGSAKVIGEMMLPVLVGADFYVKPENYPEHKDLIRTAGALGNAFQLTNFCRDVSEDVDRERIYLPRSVLLQHGVPEAEVLAKKLTPGLCSAIEQCLQLCDTWYGVGAEGIKLLAKYNKVVSVCIGTSHSLYGGISTRIRDTKYDVFGQRCRVGMKTKLGMLVPHLHLSLLPSIMEVLFHHLYLRVLKQKPISPPPIPDH